MKTIIPLLLLLLVITIGCKEPPAVDIRIVDEFTGAPVEGADVYIKKKLVGTSNRDGFVSIATADRRNIFLEVKKYDYLDRKFTAENLGLIDKIKLKPKRELSSNRSSKFSGGSFTDQEYEDFMERLESVDVSTLPEGCDYLDGIYSREASFPGGMRGLQQFILKNVEYPETSIDMDEQGKVYLSFVVDADGEIGQIEIERGVSSDLDREAKRVLRSMPKWKPQYCNGRPVATKCRLPISFTLN